MVRSIGRPAHVLSVRHFVAEAFDFPREVRRVLIISIIGRSQRQGSGTTMSIDFGIREPISMLTS